MSRLKVSLDENASRFLEEALLKALQAETEPKHWAFAVLNLVQAVELALKERLQREHPALIFRNVDKQVDTVTLQLALCRLRDIANISFSRSDRAAIQSASRWRNAIVHHQFEFSLSKAKPTLACLLGFLSSFYREQLGCTLDEVLPEQLWQEAIAIQAFGADLFERAEARIKQEEVKSVQVDWCRQCGWNAFVSTSAADSCYVCGYQPDLVECAICGDSKFPDDCDLHEISFDRFELVCQDCYDAAARADDWK